MSRTDSQPTDVDCTVRPYQPGDADDFLALYESVWGAGKGRPWFDWRFEANPFADGVEMVVATAGGRLVGAEPLVPYRIRAGDRVLDAFQPVDWIVHPEYRRQGIFTAMTERLLDRVADRAALLFNFPNEQLLPGIERLGWQTVGTVTARYRIQDAGAAAAIGASDDSRFGSRALASAGSPIVRGGLGVLDRIGSTSTAVTVDRVDGVPAETVRECYEVARPNRLHVPRNRDFLEWRFENPRWEASTYVARREGAPVTTATVAVETIGGARLGRILDVQPTPATDFDPATDDDPATGDDPPTHCGPTGDANPAPDGASATGDPPAFEAVLRAIVADHADAAVLRAPTGYYPEVCRRYGFLRDDSFPLSHVSTPTYHAVRPLDGGTGQAAVDVEDPESWLLAPCDRDVA